MLMVRYGLRLTHPTSGLLCYQLSIINYFNGALRSAITHHTSVLNV